MYEMTGAPLPIGRKRRTASANTPPQSFAVPRAARPLSDLLSRYIQSQPPTWDQHKTRIGFQEEEEE